MAAQTFQRYRRTVGRGARTAVSRVLPASDVAASPWLFGGASGRSYSDNCRSVHEAVCILPDRPECYWVIDADSEDSAAASAVGPIVFRNTLRAHRLVQAAEVIFFSHGLHDVPGLMWSRGALRVRLGHGLTAFGRATGRLPRSARRLTATVDLAPVASRMEQRHKADWGFSEEQLPITGLPRWDTLLYERSRALDLDGPPLVLYAPTSRPWHSAEDASPSGALRPMFEFLQSERLQSALTNGHFRLSLYIHQNTRYHFSHQLRFPEEIELVTSEAKLPATIASANLVISDYSSILWDALYIDTPAIFFQFDRAEHEANRGSFIDLHSRLFGPNVTTVVELLDELDHACADGFEVGAWREDRQRWQDIAFAYRDARNTQRVLNVVQSLLSSQRDLRGKRRRAGRTGRLTT
jgi:hypothetical protein